MLIQIISFLQSALRWQLLFQVSFIILFRAFLFVHSYFSATYPPVPTNLNPMQATNPPNSDEDKVDVEIKANRKSNPAALLIILMFQLKNLESTSS
jgi:hypothetical protein